MSSPASIARHPIHSMLMAIPIAWRGERLEDHGVHPTGTRSLPIFIRGEDSQGAGNGRNDLKV